MANQTVEIVQTNVTKNCLDTYVGIMTHCAYHRFDNQKDIDEFLAPIVAVVAVLKSKPIGVIEEKDLSSARRTV